MITFELFEKTIRYISKLQENEEKINELFSDIYDDFILCDGKTVDILIDLLVSQFEIEDAEDMLVYYLYELDFGRKWTINSIEDKDGRIIKLSTIEDIYNYLCGKTTYVDRKTDKCFTQKQREEAKTVYIDKNIYERFNLCKVEMMEEDIYNELTTDGIYYACIGDTAGYYGISEKEVEECIIRYEKQLKLQQTKCIIREEKMNLFDVPRGYCLAHCISADFALGAGIAVEFNNRYNMRERLLNEYGNVSSGFCRGYSIRKDEVYNLVTKQRGYDKPTYENLESALEDLKGKMEISHVTKIAMPRIGSGKDGLDWVKVKQIIEKVFKDAEIEILICYLD